MHDNRINTGKSVTLEEEKTKSHFYYVIQLLNISKKGSRVTLQPLNNFSINPGTLPTF